MDKIDADGNVYIQADDVEFGHGISMGEVGKILLTLEALYKSAKGDLREDLENMHKRLTDAQKRCANAYMHANYPEHAAAVLCKARDIETAQKEIGL